MNVCIRDEIMLSLIISKIKAALFNADIHKMQHIAICNHIA